MEDSRRLENSVRPKIFEEWPKRSHQNYREINSSVHKRAKPHQSLRAEQALEKSLFFIINIETFLSLLRQKSDNVQEFQNKVKQSQAYLEELSQEREQPFDKEQYQRQLLHYFKQIKKGNKILRDLRTILLGNLSNFDPKTTQMKHSRSEEEARQALDERIKGIKEMRRKVQESLVKYEYDIPESLILGEENNFQNSLMNLIRAMQPDNIVQFHYLMLYRLGELEKLICRLQKILIAANQNYSRYEGLNDSLSLMQNQIKEMKRDRKHMKRKFNDLVFDTAETIIPKTTQSVPILKKNVKVYQSNLQLLARYNAQTNLRYYATQRKQYTDQYNKFKTYYEKWNVQQKHAEYLYDRQQILQNFIKKREMQHNQSTLEWEKKKLEKSYLECVSYSLPQKMANIQRYKFGVAEQYEKTFIRQGVAFPKRINQPAQKFKDREFVKKSNRLQPFIDFFVRIRHKKPNQKVQYLIDNRESIDSMNYQFEKQFQRADFEEEKYWYGLKYSHAIVNYLTHHKNPNKYLEEVEGYSKHRWQALPIGLEIVVFNFTKDINTNLNSAQYLESVYQKQLDRYTKEMIKQIEWVPQWKNYRETSEIPYSASDTQPGIRRQYFIKYVRKISKYSPMVRDQMIESFWQKHEEAVKNCYDHVVRQMSSVGTVDKKNFFTFKILCYLTAENRRLKVPNIRQLIYHYLDFLKKYDKNLMVQHLFAEIIKQRILLDYLKNHLSLYMDIQPQIKAIQKVYKVTMLRYEVDDHLLLIKSDDLIPHILHSLILEQAIHQEEHGYDQIGNHKLAEVTEKVIDVFKKSPLICGNKENIEHYSFVIGVSSTINKLRKLNAFQGKGKQMEFISQVYTCCEAMINARGILSRIEFESSDIIGVKDKNKKMIYVQQYSEEADGDLNQSYMKQIRVIENLYRGQTMEDQKDMNSSTRGLVQIANMLRSMTNPNI